MEMEFIISNKSPAFTPHKYLLFYPEFQTTKNGGIAELGRSLSALGATVRVPTIEALEIEEGEYEVQRLIYHFFMKCFWNDELDPEANAAINYDWYHPKICSRHTAEEVRQWFTSCGLEIVQEHVDHYGITMRGVRPR
jgi:hypothetical protein